MDVRGALKDQYHAGLAMLADCVEKCPEDMWQSGEYPRYFWRIAMHTAFFAQVYLVQDEAAYSPWPGRPADRHEPMWQDPSALEPYELSEDAEPFTRQEVLDYIAFVDGMVDTTIDGLDLDTDYSGFRWYDQITKLSHEIMNIGHIQCHTGQLKELLMARGIDTEWVSGSGS